MKHRIFLNIGPLIYEITSANKFSVGSEYSQYVFPSLSEIEKWEKCRKIYCEVRYVKNYRNISGRLVYQNQERMVFGDRGLEQRLFADQSGVYGIAREIAENHILIELQGSEYSDISVDIIFLEMLFLERYLLREKALVLHSSFIEWEGQGTVFTAPSGIGKSTQAELWRKYENASVINGDRSIVLWNHERQAFDVCGLPFCGSSGINIRRQLPLRAIVFLTQSKENQIEEFPTYQAASKLFGEMSVNQWNRQAVSESMTLIETLANSVMMVHLACNMELEAVTILKEFLMR